MKDILTYEAPKADSDALVVESLGLRHIAERIVNNLYAAGYEPEENSIHPWKCLIFDAEKALETPATDAALAAIQAQAIEDAVKKVLFVDTVASTVVISQLLRAYAAALREAK
ncbi:hypothetical protein ACUNGR_21650 [Serratia sp. IR-2025]